MVQYKTNQIGSLKYKEKKKIDIFLEEFTKEIILNSGHKRRERQKQDFISMLRESRDNMISSQLNQSNDSVIANPEINGFDSDTRNDQFFLGNRSAIQQRALQHTVLQDSPEVEGFYLRKIQGLVNDRGVVSIECPGPGKFVSVKKRGKKMVTKIALTNNDIDSIINKFSEQTSIPRIGGTFKAIADNLIITAIDSEVVGPRFIITKIIQRKSDFI